MAIQTASLKQLLVNLLKLDMVAATPMMDPIDKKTCEVASTHSFKSDIWLKLGSIKSPKPDAGPFFHNVTTRNTMRKMYGMIEMTRLACFNRWKDDV